jgi:coproporphyrinogen III oxidase-like Fe-S oxidoreductase
VAGGSSAERLIQRVCRALERHDSRLHGWRWHKRGLDLVIEFDLVGGAAVLLVQPADVERAWCRSPSLAFSIHSDDAIASQDPGTESFLQQFVSLIRRSDSGDLQLNAAPREHRVESSGSASSDESSDVSPEPAERQKKMQRGVSKSPVFRDATQSEHAHRDLADTLHYASFVAYQATITTDLYPHVTALGDPVSTDELLADWSATLRGIQSGRAPPKLGLYVHIPFCTKACTFCYCAKTDAFDRQRFMLYVDRLSEQIQRFGPLFDGHHFTSVYFGGGTPSLLTPPAMERLFTELHDTFHIPVGTQIIFEGNPASLSERKIQLLAERGRVTRLTVGVQTLDEEVQARVHRWNTHAQVATAVEAGRAHGIDHVNTDLMAGLPGQSMESFQRDFEFLMSLDPDSIHINPYRPLPRTGLEREGTSMELEQLELRERMLTWGRRQLREGGHASGMGQAPRKTRDAANIQEYDLRRQNSSLLGLGFPASSHAFGRSFYQPRMRGGFDETLSQELEGEAEWMAVPSSEVEERHKYLVSNLRTGFSRVEFRELFGLDVAEAVPDMLEKLQDLGVACLGEEELHSRTGTHAENLIYRVLLYSPMMMERIDRKWGGLYDPDVDYRERLSTLIEAQRD